MRIYILGASCTGTTTLGAGLAGALGLVHVDTDDHYWAPVEPPFSVKREPQHRVLSMRAALGQGGWVLSGSCMGWGDEITAGADVFLFLTLDQEIRLSRLKQREQERFGDRIEAGGDMFQIHQDFLAWAAQYENPAFHGRSRARHQAWLAHQTAPVVELDASLSPEALLEKARAALA